MFIGEGPTDYVIQKLNKLNALAGIEVISVVDRHGRGHVAVGTHTTREGVRYTLIELRGIVCKRFSDESYWSYEGLAQVIKAEHPDIVSVSFKYVRMFFCDEALKQAVKDLNIKLVLNDNPEHIEYYDERKKEILAGGHQEEYTPFYALYVASAISKLGIVKEDTVRHFCMNVLRAVGIASKKGSIQALLQRLEEWKRIYNSVGAIISYTEWAFKVFPTYGVPKENIFVKYNSPDTDMLFEIREKIKKETPILPPNPHRLLHLSRLVPVKRVDLIIEALSMLKKEFPDIELVVVGRGPDTEALKDLAKRLNVADAVRFCGWQSYEDVGRYLLASTIYILAGHGGLSINDAMTFGKPVICSHAPDGTEKHLVFEGHNGLYFKEGDANDLAEKIRRLFRNPALIKEMGERSTEIIKTKVNIHTVMNAYQAAWKYARTH